MKAPHRIFLSVSPLALLVLASSCGGSAPNLPPEEAVKVPAGGSLVVYVEAPARTAGPVLKTFEEQTGIIVTANYRDTLGDRFMPAFKEEAAQKRVDLFWGDSPLAAIDLVDEGLAVPFRPAGARPVPAQYHDRQFRWIGFAANPRVFIYNTNLMKQEDAPGETSELARAPWAGRGAMPRIASGAPAFHAAALYALWGKERARTFFAALQSNGTAIVEDDRAVRGLVASGKASWGMLGLDEAICARREAEPINILFADRMGMGTVVPPQVAVLMRGAPHPEQAKGLFGYLFATEGAWLFGQNDCPLVTFLPDIPKPEWVPSIGSFNVALLDPELAARAYRENRDAFLSWGAGNGAPPP
ncbi:MAG TPA: extracellular solute-binding protein [Candidatus Polarisedimenticolia bacterium]|jgi:iron(III) transport system substrate-binding protein|nr:extracellular solute-binding protein [Candidatus Polarisedimenticolia bacterium]